MNHARRIELRNSSLAETQSNQDFLLSMAKLQYNNNGNHISSGIVGKKKSNPKPPTLNKDVLKDILSLNFMKGIVEPMLQDLLFKKEAEMVDAEDDEEEDDAE